MPLRLAILEADTPVPLTHAHYHGYLGVFRHLFTRAASPTPLDSIITLTGHDVVSNGHARPNSPAYPSLDDVDAILITGSKHTAFADDEWVVRLVDFVRSALEHPRRIKIVGICFGHQIVARALGTEVGRSDAGWEVSVTETKLTPLGKSVFFGSPSSSSSSSSSSEVSTNRDTLSIQQMHRDQVLGLPEGAQLLASTDVCPNHGFLIPGRVITVQGHPEFTADIMREILDLRHEAGIFPDDVYASGVERNGDHHDGVLVARAILRFLQEP
ncbi:hypothetical protein VTJ49DRAFT_5064 [Mycothermus thermophilus]|uniref:Glutamine amidotransferase domain-containing protein n=1 Tax=Humicola insolens TaxID=85995 RepID=A0ABR3V522_HUMIN